MTHFIKQGNTMSIAPDEALDIRPTLPTATYTVGFSMERGYYLELVDSFTIPSKLYGDTRKHAKRIFKTFHDREQSTGILLSGEKGSGKTMLAKFLAVQGLAQGMPTIIVNAPHYGESFNTFIQQIDQPIVMIFDEFEKVYDRDQQAQLLTLLDGVYPSKKMFILTCNDRYRIDTHMNNRPGRIFYHLSYQGLDVDFIMEYCLDNLDNKDRAEEVARISLAFSQFNFDIMKALVEEMNRYDESARDALAMLNANPEDSEHAHKVEVWIDGEEVILEEPTFHGAPLVNGIDTWFTVKVDDDETPIEDDKNLDAYERHEREMRVYRQRQRRLLKRQQGNFADWEKALLVDDEGDLKVKFTPADLTDVDVKSGTFTFEADRIRVKLTREVAKVTHWAAY